MHAHKHTHTHTHTHTHRSLLSKNEVGLLGVKVPQDKQLHVLLHHTLNLPLAVAGCVQPLKQDVNHLGQAHKARGEGLDTLVRIASQVEEAGIRIIDRSKALSRAGNEQRMALPLEGLADPRFQNGIFSGKDSDTFLLLNLVFSLKKK